MTGRTAPLLIALLSLGAAEALAASGSDDCLAAWRVAQSEGRSGDAAVVCADGDPGCDDGAADGTCRVPVAVCLNVGGCRPAAVEAVEIRGAAAGLFPSLDSMIPTAESAAGPCTAPAVLSVPLGERRRRTATARLRAGDATGRRRDVDRLRVTCVRPKGGRAVVASTDFETGALVTVSLRPPRRVVTSRVPIHSDPVIRVSGGMLFVLNRFLADNVQRLDSRGALRMRFQCSTGTGSNPHDLVVVESNKAYVTRYDRPELWIVDPSVRDCGRFRRGTIDLSRFADRDGLPEMDQMAVVGGRLFVAVQRLDRNRGWKPSGSSALVVIDVASDTVVKEIVLHGTNPFGDASGIGREPGSGRLVVSSVGDIYRIGDGGLERIDPLTLEAEGRFFVDEATLGGNVLDFVLIGPTRGYAIVQEADLRNRLVAFDPTGASPVQSVYSGEAFLPDIAIGPDGLLWLADHGIRDPGIHLFDPATGTRRTRLDVGLPPFSVGFLP